MIKRLKVKITHDRDLKKTLCVSDDELIGISLCSVCWMLLQCANQMLMSPKLHVIKFLKQKIACDRDLKKHFMLVMMN